MHSLDILEYGHKTLMDSIAGLTETEWNTIGAAGEWTPKDVIAHLASFEHILIDVLDSLRDIKPTPTLDRWLQDPERFSAVEVVVRQHQSARAVVAEYAAAFDETVNQIIRIPERRLRTTGALPWYGAEYDAEDFIVYSFYGHKREHSAQIAALRSRLALPVPAQAARRLPAANGSYHPYSSYPLEGLR